MEETPHLDIDDLYESKQKIDINRVNLYNKLITKIHSKIRTASRQRNSKAFCHYVMPEVLIGYPNYNFEECLFYVIHVLKEDGFLVRYIHPNLILISWNHWVPNYVREEIYRKTGKKIDKYGNEIQDSKQSKHVGKSTIVNNDAKEKQNNLNNKYTPTGKFIYSKDILDTIREVI